MALRQAMTVQTLSALGLALLLSGCGFFRTSDEQPVIIPVEMAASEPALACPWVDAERYRAPVRLAGPSSAAIPQPVPFVAGCAIVRFRVAADGSVYMPALRAAYPLNDGPTALAAVQQMRFQPGRKPETEFVLRVSVKHDNAGHVLVATETRPGTTFFGRYF